MPGASGARKWPAARGRGLPPCLPRATFSIMTSGPADLTERDVPPCGCCDPGAAHAALCYCGVEDLLRIIRRRYSLAVMNVIHGRGEARYHDVADALPAMSSSTLAETLHALAAARLLDRLVTDERPQAVYRLTGSGVKLLSRLRQLLAELDAT